MARNPKPSRLAWARARRKLSRHHGLAINPESLADGVMGCLYGTSLLVTERIPRQQLPAPLSGGLHA